MNITLNRTHLIFSAKDKPTQDVTITDLRQEARAACLKAARVTIEGGGDVKVLKDRAGHYTTVK